MGQEPYTKTLTVLLYINFPLRPHSFFITVAYILYMTLLGWLDCIQSSVLSVLTLYMYKHNVKQYYDC